MCRVMSLLRITFSRHKSESTIRRLTTLTIMKLKSIMRLNSLPKVPANLQKKIMTAMLAF